MQPEAIVQFNVIRGVNLPRTDLTSKIDAYVKVKSSAFTGKTKAKEDTDNPVWDTSFFFTVPLGPNRVPASIITLELWDENTFKDSHIGSAQLNLAQVQPSQLGYIELPLTWEKDKYGAQGKQSRLVVGVVGWVASFGTLMAATHHIPGALFNTVDRRAYIPLQHPTLHPGQVYLGCEYETDAVDFKVYVCMPNAPLFVDMAMAGRQHTKVRRRVYSSGKVIMPGLTAFEEIKLDDVPLSTDLRQLLVLCFDKTLLCESNSNMVVSAHGWRGTLGFQEACRTLHNVDVDHSEQEIYMRLIDDVPGAAMLPTEALLLVDYDKDDVGELLNCCQPGREDNVSCLVDVASLRSGMLPVDYDKQGVDIKLAVLNTPSALDKAWDITIHSGQEVKKTSEIFVPPKVKLGGKYQIARIYELDDIAYGTSFSDILLHNFQLSNQRQWDVASVLPLK